MFIYNEHSRCNEQNPDGNRFEIDLKQPPKS